MRRLTKAEWEAEASQRFGADPMRWAFVCPSCCHVQTVQDYKDAGAPVSAVAFSCVGRWKGGLETRTFLRSGGPCTYAGGGLIGLNPVTVEFPDETAKDVFEFAPEVSRCAD